MAVMKNIFQNTSAKKTCSKKQAPKKFSKRQPNHIFKYLQFRSVI